MTYKHKEAFCLMTYKCTTCGAVEKLWNSRDGVTPFFLSCAVCDANRLAGITNLAFAPDRAFAGMEHVLNRDVLAVDYTVPVGSRYFADMTLERAKVLAEKSAARLRSLGIIPEVEADDVVEGLASSFYGEGTTPDVLTKG